MRIIEMTAMGAFGKHAEKVNTCCALIYDWNQLTGVSELKEKTTKLSTGSGIYRLIKRKNAGFYSYRFIKRGGK
jgi:hypothetical protein